ncbi:MAG TPA: ATP-binding protein [Polyangia bacterium]|nr:ATP-binding protein [Polyangia bacterium]
MRIRTKILLLVVLGAVVPLVASHLLVGRMNAESMRRLIAGGLAASAAQTSARLDERLRWTVRQVDAVSESVPFESFSSEDRDRALQIPYRQLAEATVVVLLDGSGRALAAPYHPDAATARLLGRQPVTDGDLARMAERVPFGAVLESGVALGPVYRSEVGAPRMVLASGFPVVGADGSWVLAVELDLSGICELVAAAENADLADREQQAICPAPDRDTGAMVLEVTADVPLTGWRLTVRHPESSAMAPLWRSMTWSGIWAAVALLIAVLGGGILARGITGPLSDLERAAVRVAGGDYEQRLPEQSLDETGRLAAAFNTMTAEIRAWNAELTSRVEDGTRELREAQQQILQAQKLAAVGELGAGVAHEINNPLTSVLGMAQLLQADAGPGTELHGTLGEIIASARRVAEVVDSLLRFSQSQVAAGQERIDPTGVLDRAAALFASRFEEWRIGVERSYAPGCEINGASGELEVAFVHLLDNAARAMPTGGRLRLEVSRVEGGAVRVTVADAGSGMSPEVRERALDPFFTTAPPGSGARGVGLAVVQRVVNEHGGRIVLDSAPGEGTSVRLYFPGAAKLSKS